MLLDKCWEVDYSKRLSSAAIASTLSSSEFAVNSSQSVAAYLRSFAGPKIEPPPSDAGLERFNLAADFVDRQEEAPPPWRIVANCKTGTQFMVKQIHTDDARELREYESHKPIVFPSIAPFVGYALFPGGIALFRKRIFPPRAARTSDCDIASLLEAGMWIHKRDVLIIALGVAKAIGWLHRRGDAHGNLRASNVLLNPRFEPFVVGYGVSATARAREGLDVRTAGDSSLFCAPEVCESESFGPKADIFALGTLIYVIHGQQLPTEDESVRQNIIEGKRPAIENGVPGPYRDLLDKLWEYNPDDRPTADEVVQELLSPAFRSLTKQPALREYLTRFGEAFPRNSQGK
jgi:hypothetical protein